MTLRGFPGARREGPVRLYGTSYVHGPGGGQYHSHVWARGPAHALVVMSARGLGEVPNGWTDPDEPRASWLLRRYLDARVRRKPTLGQVMHGLTHLAHLATSSGVCTADGAVGDSGWLHEAVHRLCWTDDPLSWRPYVEAVQAVEQRVPGYIHPGAPHPRYTGRRG